MQIPRYEQQARSTHHGDEYLRASDMPEAWGASINHAVSKLGESVAIFGQNMKKVNDDISRARIAELSNAIDDLSYKYLSDPETGYLTLMGKNAMQTPENPDGGAINVLTKIDDEITKKQKELGLNNGVYKYLSDLTKTKKMDMMYRSATSHEYKQSLQYAKNENDMLIVNAVQKGILNRNDETDMQIALNNGKTAIIQNARLNKLDESATKIALAKYTSDFHEKIIESYIHDNDLRANEYFEKHKQEILPDTQVSLQRSLKNNETKYVAKTLASELFNLYPDDEEKAFQALSDKNLSPDDEDYTSAKLRQLYSEQNHFKKLQEDNAVNTFFEKAMPYIQKGERAPVELLPDNIDPKTKLSLLSYINQGGNPKTDDDMWQKLYEYKVNNAQAFANLNLNKYRGYLSDSEYKNFLKEQQRIKSGDYYTVIKDDDKKIDTALQALGLNTGDRKKVIYSEIRSLVREFEARKGRSINDVELQNILNSMGYTGSDKVRIYKELEQGMAKRTGFIREVVNDFAYYQSKHNGELPPDSEKEKIIQNRIAMSVAEQNKFIVNEFKLNDNKVGGMYNGRRITSAFGKRKPPVPKASSDHKGLDLAYGFDEHLQAFAGGKVVETGNSNSFGRYICIKDDNGIIHKYAHLNFVGVSKGMTIKKGDVIGRTGSSGISSGPHLHYETSYNGVQINPFYVLDNSSTQQAKQIPASEQAQTSVKTAVNDKKIDDDGWAF